MINKFKTKAFNLIVSILALILLLPFMISNYIFARGSFFEDFQNDGMIYSPMMVKYGGPSAPFDIELLKLCKIYGAVFSKETKLAVPGAKIKITKPAIQTICDESGYFAFELYNLVYDTFELEIRDGKTDALLQTREVVFPTKDFVHTESLNQIRGIKNNEDRANKNFVIMEETLEIFI